MVSRYEMEAEDGGTWRVIDRFTGLPACWDDVPQTGLELSQADDLTDLFNLLDTAKRETGQPMPRLG